MNRLVNLNVSYKSLSGDLNKSGMNYDNLSIYSM